MKFQTKTLTQGILSISIICVVLLSCSEEDNKTEFIEGTLISKRYKYEYNPNGFINTPYGKVNISTQSYFKKGKLVKLLWNRANGFLEYKIEDFRKDSMLYHSLNVDTLFIKNKEKKLKYKTSTTRNDTVFYKDNQKIIIYID